MHSLLKRQQFKIAECYRIRVKVVRVGQNRICIPYMTGCMVNFMPKVLYIHRIYVCMCDFVQPF